MNATSNLDRSGKRARLIGGVVALLLGITASILMASRAVEPTWRWTAVVIFFPGFLGLFQARAST